MKLVLPVDTHAEEVLAACATLSRDGTRLALSHLTGDHFYDQRCWRTIVAAAALDRDHPEVSDYTLDDDLHIVDTRLLTLAEKAAVDPGWLRSIRRQSPVMADIGGRYTQRVNDTYERRRRFTELLAELEMVAS